MAKKVNGSLPSLLLKPCHVLCICSFYCVCASVVVVTGVVLHVAKWRIK